MPNANFGSQFKILLGEDINQAVETKYLIISPFQKESVQPTSYDISIGAILDFPVEIENDKDLLNGEKLDFSLVELGPSQCILFLTEETFSFPSDMFAEIFLRSRYARQLNSGGHLGRIECGWKGRLVLELSNQSLDRTVKFKKGDPIATIVIYKIDSTSDYCYKGLFQNSE
ncbi:MAG: hypothetical protein GX603_08290 [Chloroflexi bacterium]|nr:hypothetical protein [Chloroflexota bacterium]